MFLKIITTVSVLILTGTAFAWVEGTQPVGLTLPYSGTVASDGAAFRIINTGIGTGSYFQVNNAASNNPAIVGINNGTGPAIRGSATGTGIAGDFNGEVHIDGAVTKEYTSGTSNSAVPIAYGYIKSDGSIGKATPNVTSAWNPTAEDYEITIAGENYLFDRYVTVVTANWQMATSVMPAIYSTAGKLIVYLYNTSHNRIPGPFYFITFKP
jgi:hypothetical protein